MPTYLVRLAQTHESFRKAELQALADLAGVKLEFIKYDENVGICMLRSTVFLFVTIFFPNTHVFISPNVPSLHTAL